MARMYVRDQLATFALRECEPTAKLIQSSSSTLDQLSAFSTLPCLQPAGSWSLPSNILLPSLPLLYKPCLQFMTTFVCWHFNTIPRPLHCRLSSRIVSLSFGVFYAENETVSSGRSHQNNPQEIQNGGYSQVQSSTDQITLVPHPNVRTLFKFHTNCSTLSKEGKKFTNRMTPTYSEPHRCRQIETEWFSQRFRVRVRVSALQSKQKLRSWRSL